MPAIFKGPLSSFIGALDRQGRGLSTDRFRPLAERVKETQYRDGRGECDA